MWPNCLWSRIWFLSYFSYSTLKVASKERNPSFYECSPFLGLFQHFWKLQQSAFIGKRRLIFWAFISAEAQKSARYFSHGPEFSNKSLLYILFYCNFLPRNWIYPPVVCNLFVTSKNETTNSPIHEFKVLQNVFKMKNQGLKCFLK